MVQKSVLLPTAPKTNASANAPQATTTAACVMPPMRSSSCFGPNSSVAPGGFGRAPGTRVGSGSPAARKPSRRMRHASHAPQARPSASAS